MRGWGWLWRGLLDSAACDVSYDGVSQFDRDEIGKGYDHDYF